MGQSPNNMQKVFVAGDPPVEYAVKFKAAGSDAKQEMQALIYQIGWEKISEMWTEEDNH